MNLSEAIKAIVLQNSVDRVVKSLVEGDAEDRELQRRISMGDEEAIAHFRARQVRTGEADPKVARAMDALDAMHRDQGKNEKWYALVNAARLAKQAIVFTAPNGQELRVVYIDSVGVGATYSITPALRKPTGWVRLHVIRQGLVRGREGSYDHITVVPPLRGTTIRFSLIPATRENPTPTIRRV